MKSNFIYFKQDHKTGQTKGFTSQGLNIILKGSLLPKLGGITDLVASNRQI